MADKAGDGETLVEESAELRKTKTKGMSRQTNKEAVGQAGQASSQTVR
jgi:hypothetical protein